MKVINTAGFEVKFEKNEKTYRIPDDGLLHFIPDECFFNDNFQGLLRVIIPPVEVKKVIKEIEIIKSDFNEPEIKEIIIDKIQDKKEKPLKGIKIKKELRSDLKKTKPTNKKNKLEEELNGKNN